MNALPLLSELADQGIRLRVVGNNLAVSPREKITHALATRIRSNKPAILYDLNLLEKKAGDDWPEIISDPNQYRAFSEMNLISEMRQQGTVPADYTNVFDCPHCGPVPVLQNYPQETRSCPWCMNRVIGLPVPSVTTEYAAWISRQRGNN